MKTRSAPSSATIEEAVARSPVITRGLPSWLVLGLVLQLVPQQVLQQVGCLEDYLEEAPGLVLQLALGLVLRLAPQQVDCLEDYLEEDILLHTQVASLYHQAAPPHHQVD